MAKYPQGASDRDDSGKTYGPESVTRSVTGRTGDESKSLMIDGGETGIRTLDTLRYTRFPSVRLQPLGHLSVVQPHLRTLTDSAAPDLPPGSALLPGRVSHSFNPGDPLPLHAVVFSSSEGEREGVPDSPHFPARTRSSTGRAFDS